MEHISPVIRTATKKFSSANQEKKTYLVSAVGEEDFHAAFGALMIEHFAAAVTYRLHFLVAFGAKTFRIHFDS